MLLGGDPLHRAHADEARALGRGHHREPAWLDVTQARPGTEHLTELWRESVQRQPGHRHRQHSLHDRAARYVLVLAPCLRVAHGHCFFQADPPPNAEASTRSGPPRPRRTEPRRGTRADRGNTAEVPHRRRSTRLPRAMRSARVVLAMIRSRDRFNTIRSGGEPREASRAPRNRVPWARLIRRDIPCGRVPSIEAPAPTSLTEAGHTLAILAGAARALAVGQLEPS